MKFTIDWLKQHLETDASLEEILTALNAIGLEVEGVDNPGAALAPFKVAHVLSAERHPQADKLQVLQIDQGDGQPLQVVCGAPNARAGMKGVFGPVGAYVPGADFTLKLAEIRGVVSNGMMCSARELQIGEGHEGIIELPEDAPVGAAYADYAGLNEPVIDVSITPNRQDCMGVRGIARDLAAKGLGTLKPLAVPVIAGQGAGPDVRTEDPDGCPAFYARSVHGVRNGASPEWMQRRLKAVGQKPISALVDITNYVMLDLGRPLHVYDAATLQGGLVARKARANEEVAALNGKTYALDETMTVIADDAAAHDIGGIMGGEHSGAQHGTTDVLIECAYFDPDHIARTGQKLNLSSDARQRFERGVDPAFLADGLDIATGLVLSICGGTATDMTRAGAAPAEPRTIAFHPDHTRTLGGLEVALERQAEILESLGFSILGHSRESGHPSHEAPNREAAEMDPRLRGGDVWDVTVPSWRRDVQGSADLVEEVVRIHGIEHVPSTPLPRMAGVAKPTATPEQRIERRVRRAAAGAPVDKLMVMPVEAGDAAIWHPGQSGTLRLGPKQVLAEFGTLHPALAKAFDLDGTVVAGQIFLNALPARKNAAPIRDAYAPPLQQAVTRDFAFLVDAKMPAADLLRAVKGADKASITDARLFDSFAGQGVPEGQKSLAVEITLQPGDKSFTEAELKALSDKIVAAATKLGAVLRG